MADLILTTYKTCTKCNATLAASADNFYRQKSKKDGLKAECRTCSLDRKHKHDRENRSEINAKAKARRLNNPERAKAIERIYYAKVKRDPEFVAKNRKRVRVWQLENPAIVAKRNAEYRERHKDRLSIERRERYDPEKAGQHYQKNRVKYLKKAADWASANPVKRAEILRRHKSKMMQIPGYRLNNSVSAQIRMSLNNKGGIGWQSIVGFTLDELKKHLERQFQKGMSWDNYGEWHVDHITPVSSFDFSAPDDADFKACWVLTNLRPLWATENIKKSNKIQFLL